MKHARIDHDRCQALLGEYVNGRLDSSLSRAVHAHLAQCHACFVAQQDAHAVRSALAACEEATAELLTDARCETGLARLLQTLDVAATDRDTVRPGVRRLAQLWTATPGAVRLAFGVQTVALAASLLLTLALPGRPSLPADADAYRTFTQAAPETRDDRVRVVFAPGLSEADMRALLLAVNMQIVAGPSSAGVYTVAPGPAREDQDALATLRNSDLVRFAEPEATGSQPVTGR